MSAFYDQASLVVVPSGYKAGKVYAQKPLTTDGQLTFSRASTATRVNSAGLIEKVRINLATYSEQLNNTSGWGFEQLAVTANAVANPIDGAVTADKIYATVTGSSVPILKQYTAATANQTVTVSGYFKKAEYDYVVIHGFGLGGTVFNLAAGTKSGAGTITSLGNGWYRCAAVLAISGDARIFITPSVDGNVGYTSTANSGVYAFGMQFELGDIATDYIPTTTAAVSVGPVANVPRLDYLGSTCGKLNLEPQRTNVNIYSESFGLSGSLTLATATYNTTTSPDGYVNADSFLDTTDNNIHALLNVFTKAASPVTYTYSLFVKAKDSGMKIQLSMDDAVVGGGDSGIFNPSTGTFITNMSTPTAGYTNPSRSVTSYGNGWYRISFTITTSTATFNRYNAFIVNASNSTVYAGTGTGVYVWGAQMEEGAYATSYIPTLGAAVTRGADACSKTGISSLIGQTEGTLYAEITAQPSPANNWFQITDGTANNWVFIGLDANSFRGYIRLGASTVFSDTSFTLTSGVPAKIALGYKSGDIALYINGTQIAVSSATFTPSASIDRVVFGDLVNPPQDAAKYSQALLFKTRLTNAQLAELTTL